jgi:GAF domain-containing protein
VHGALRFLNARTFHRYTGLYRFDGAMLRNVALFDRESPALVRGVDAPMGDTYCGIVGAGERTFATADTRADPRVADHPARDAIVSYCGALVRGADGRALGTLCSFDVEPRPVPVHEIPLLEAVAPLLARHVLDDAVVVPGPGAA